MTAPELSPEEQQIVARFDAAPTPPEVLREHLAQAAWEASDDHEDDPSVEWENNYARTEWYRIADAALAVFRGQQDPAVQRVLELAGELDDLARKTEASIADREHDMYWADQLGLAMGYRRAAIRIRAALDA